MNSGNPDPDRARMFAEVAHAGQVYAEEVAYSHHTNCVVEVLKRFGFTDPVMLCAGSLHDVIEDTNRSYNDVKSRFGEDVAELVYTVTNELGRNRKERNEKTYPKIRGNYRATALKLADRIANVEYSSANGGKQDMYMKEYSSFKAALFCMSGEDMKDGRVERMWKHLDRLLGDANGTTA